MIAASPASGGRMHPSAIPSMPFTTKEALMVRVRLATVAVAAGLGLVCGCLNLTHRPLLDRLRCGPAAAGECCETGAAPACEGPVLDAGAPVLVPGAPGGVIGPPLTPQNGAPALTPTPRLVPQPQAPTMPYTPPGGGV